jgi:hypothetical protein
VILLLAQSKAPCIWTALAERRHMRRPDQDNRSSVSLKMLTNSIIGMIRRRWRSERPYAGHTTESLQRKIACEAVAEWARELALRELSQRDRDR